MNLNILGILIKFVGPTAWLKDPLISPSVVLGLELVLKVETIYLGCHCPTTAMQDTHGVGKSAIPKKGSTLSPYLVVKGKDIAQWQ